MFSQLLERVLKLYEVVGVKSLSVKDKERLLKQKYKNVLNKLVPGADKGYLKFWLLSDGSILPVKKTHRDTITKANIQALNPEYTEGDELEDKFEDEFDAIYGLKAIQGHVTTGTGEMDIRGDWQTEANNTYIFKLTDKQIATLRNLYIKYRIKTLVMENPDDMYALQPIKNVKELDYYLRYGISVDS